MIKIWEILPLMFKSWLSYLCFIVMADSLLQQKWSLRTDRSLVLTYVVSMFLLAIVSLSKFLLISNPNDLAVKLVITILSSFLYDVVFLLPIVFATKIMAVMMQNIYAISLSRARRIALRKTLLHIIVIVSLSLSLYCLSLYCCCTVYCFLTPDRNPFTSLIPLSSSAIIVVLYIVFFSSLSRDGKGYVTGVIALVLLGFSLLLLLSPCFFALKTCSLTSEVDKVREVAWLALQCTMPVAYIEGHGVLSQYLMLHRSKCDILRHLLIGVGSCGEIALTERFILSIAGVRSRVVAFPGEDHVFVEVYVNDSWMVSDPGYGPEFFLMSREERVKKRLEEYGAISYVVAYEDGRSVELTSEYVPVDVVVIRVMREDKPVSGAMVVLRHVFAGRELLLPVFYTNESGYVVLRLGSMKYNEKAQPAEDYYRIYVNNTLMCNVTSYGNGTIHEVTLTLPS